MGQTIECPYFIATKRKTISCEGCMKFFPEPEKKDDYLKNYCGGNYYKCKYQKDIKKIYDNYDGDELRDKLKDFYLAQNRKLARSLIQRVGIMEKNIADNIETKQTEISKLHTALNVAKGREGMALLALASMMNEQKVRFYDLRKVEEFKKKYHFKVEPAKGNEYLVELVVKEKEQ